MEFRRHTFILLTAGLLLAPIPCFPQSMRVEDLAQGKIIITPRESPDPHFANSVIVLARYDRTGALGLMLHYKSDLTIQKLFAGLKGIEKRNDPLYVGGPVEIPTVLALLRAKTAPAGAGWVTGGLYLLASKLTIGTALMDAQSATNLRVFIGYSGWGPGQLEREALRRGWYIFDYDEDLVFDGHPDSLWERMIAKTGRQLAIRETVPFGRTPQPKRGPI